MRLADVPWYRVSEFARFRRFDFGPPYGEKPHRYSLLEMLPDNPSGWGPYAFIDQERRERNLPRADNLSAIEVQAILFTYLGG